MVEFALQLLLLAQATMAPQPTAADVLRAAKNAIIRAQSVAYVVSRDYTDSSGKKHKGETSVLIAKSPFGFRAEHRQDDGSHSETSVSDGKTTNTISDGKQDQEPTFTPDGSGAMITESDAAADVGATWHLFLDADYLQRAIESGRTLYLWEDEIQSDPCSVIVYARDHWTDYFWISTKTGFPRATQRLSMRRGRAVLSVRYEIADIRLNPQIQPHAFQLANALGAASPSSSSRPSPSQLQESAGSAAITHLIGRRLPDLELRDPEFKARWLSDLRGKPTLITFWAPWCSPCREELAALDRIQNSSKSPLQIVAIAVQDRRTHAVDFIRGHEEYKFLFFTDPDMEKETSPLASFFGVVGIPVTVLADPQGQIVESWSGYDGEEDLQRKLTKFSPP
jgi:thiol-disulfide isomerase/thioredoxin/outer membrane lipoprotein-sorting protein